MSNLGIKIAGVEFKNPVMTASGTFGSGMEYGEFVEVTAMADARARGTLKKYLAEPEEETEDEGE
jgi:dihydroorotate dehydrogenase